jgi:hypothetical protein
MSLKETVDARCPSCGEESSTAVWRSMNVTQDPDAKELLLAGTVNAVPNGMQVKPGMEYLTHPHIVFDMGELVRYVAFRDRLHELGCSESGPAS